MRRFAAAFAFVFVTSLVLGSYGHCWPMLAAQMSLEAAAETSHHHHGAPQKQHHHPTEGLGQELSVPGVQAAAAVVPAPVAKSFVPVVLLAVAVLQPSPSEGEARPDHRARAGPPAFAEFHARTGRLLI